MPLWICRSNCNVSLSRFSTARQYSSRFSIYYQSKQNGAEEKRFKRPGDRQKSTRFLRIILYPAKQFLILLYLFIFSFFCFVLIVTDIIFKILYDFQRFILKLLFEFFLECCFASVIKSAWTSYKYFLRRLKSISFLNITSNRVYEISKFTTILL